MADLSFAKDIRPLFTDTDADHMAFMMDLRDRDGVAENADAILTAVRNGTMPPPGSGGVRWTVQMCDTFAQWVKEGCPP